MASNLAKGKAKVGYVLPEGLIERIKLRAVRQKVRPSTAAEELLLLGLKSLKASKAEAESARTS